jgi:DNA-binding response OmpR family regulator
MNNARILITDDEECVRTLIKKSLERENMKVFQAKSGKETLNILQEESFDLIILDVMTGDMNGFDVLKEIRKTDVHTPVIMLSGRGEDYDKILGLGMGADNYITKPFSPAVLCAQVQAIIRRNKEIMNVKENTKKLTVGPFVFNYKTYKCYKNNDELPLTSKETKLMKFFMENPNQVFTKEQLYQNVWEDAIVDDNSIMVYIRHLRAKIEDNPEKPTYIQTVWGIGYRFSVES